MIKINRPSVVPLKLSNKGKTANDKNCRLYDANPQSYIDGKKINIKSSIYGHSSVKRILKDVQKNKCCFCEKNQVDEFGAVEHFRPKNGYKSNKKEKLKKPGYYWLGYAWGNLFFVCSICNSTYKGNLFPLQNETLRAKSHNDDISREITLLIDPSGLMDPRDHIYFENELIRGRTDFGKKTIEVCGLDRASLNDKRKKLISDIETRIVILANKDRINSHEVDKAKEYLRKSLTPEGEFSATAMDFITNLGIVVV